MTKDMIQQLLGPAKDVLAVLNVASSMYPGVQVIAILPPSSRMVLISQLGCSRGIWCKATFFQPAILLMRRKDSG